MLKIVSIKDIKSNTFHDPQVFAHEVEAMRAVANSANNPQSTLNKYPHDFEVWLIAEFDTLTGETVPNLSLIQTVFNLKELNNDKA